MADRVAGWIQIGQLLTGVHHPQHVSVTYTVGILHQNPIKNPLIPKDAL